MSKGGSPLCKTNSAVPVKTYVGIVVGYELLETEDSDQPAALRPQPGTGVAYADIGQLASKEEIISGLKNFKISSKKKELQDMK